MELQLFLEHFHVLSLLNARVFAAADLEVPRSLAVQLAVLVFALNLLVKAVLVLFVDLEHRHSADRLLGVLFGYTGAADCLETH